ncbi:MAG: hypothetical protein V1495_00165 [Pseudomonadota bacterium]
MRKVLILTYVFPPVGGAGVQRTLKWTKYLPEFGWKPYLMTAKNPSVPLHDDSLAAEIPADLPIRRTRTFELPYKMKRSAFAKAEGKGSFSPLRSVKNLAQRFLFPDPQIGWWPTTYLSAVQWIRSEKIDTLLVSAPPFSTFLLGRKIAEKTGVPFFADFRDEWADFYTRAYDFHRRPGQMERIERMERSVVESAASLIAATDGIVANYRKKYSKLGEGNSFWIPNGYDEEDFEGTEPPSDDPKRFTLTYAGTVFEVTSAAPFLTGLKSLLERRPDLRPLLRVRFVGRIVPGEMARFEDPTLAGVVERTEYVPHAEAVKIVRSSDALLLLLADMPGSERILTGKVFEYLAARRPILAVVPPGEAQRLVEHLHAGTVVSPQNVASEIERMVEAWRAGRLTRPAGEITRFSRRETTRALGQTLNRGLFRGAEFR